ncbi:hypothetical protein BVRB_8g195170 [Beta vulgaris subsp. vulgaris]|nr:hypothetical protein BVRB_8g195170 [Beta vulgaris subsp. vulgaris]
MYRSASATRFSDEFPGSDAEELPLYRPFSEVSKKESGLQRKLSIPAEHFIHFIPVLLILCCFILWFNSHPIEKI